MKKLLALLLALTMVLTLAACGGKESSAAPSPTLAPETGSGASDASQPASDTPTVPPDTGGETASAPGAVEITLPDGESIIDVELLTGTFYIGANDGGDPENPYSFNKVYTAGMDGAAPTLLYTHSDYTPESLIPSLDGSVWLNSYAWDFDTQTSASSLIHVGVDGAVLATIDPIAVTGGFVDGSIIYPAADGGVTILSGTTFYNLDSAGSLVSQSELSGGYLQYPVILPDGQMIALQQSYGLDGTHSSSFVRADPATGSTTAIPLQSDEDLNYASTLCVDGNTLWFTRMNTVYTLDMTTGTETELYSLVNAGINTYDMKASFVKDGNLWSAESPSDDSVLKATAGSDTLTLYPARTGEDTRTVLTLATMRTDYYLTPLVAKFNRVNQEYRVEVKDYTADNPWIDQALDQLNYDIIGGDIPDMYILDSMPRSTLTKQGLLADLSPYLESDPDIHMEDYFSKVIDASRENGQLLSLFASFRIDSLAALPDQGVTVENNTLENLFALQTQDMNTAVLYCTEDTRAELASELLIRSPEGMLDLENATCDFNGVRFRALAELFAAMPLTQSDSYTGTISSAAPYRLFNTSLTKYADIVFDNLNGWSPANGGEQPISQAGSTLVGWPSSDGGVYVVSINNEFAISSQSAHPDACWAFLRQFLQDDCQQDVLVSGEGFVLKRSVMADCAALLTQYDAMTQDDIDTVNALFESDRLRVEQSSLLYDISGIVAEELTPYYEGSTDLDTVIANLQSRVSLYLSEQS